MTEVRGSLRNMLFNTSRASIIASVLQGLLGTGSICWSVEEREARDNDEDDDDVKREADAEEGGGAGGEMRLDDIMGSFVCVSVVEVTLWLSEFKENNTSSSSLSSGGKLSGAGWLSRCDCCCSCKNASRLKSSTVDPDGAERLSTTWVEVEVVFTVRSRTSSRGFVREKEGKEMYGVDRVDRLGAGEDTVNILDRYSCCCCTMSLWSSRALRSSCACCSFSLRRCFTSLSILISS